MGTKVEVKISRIVDGDTIRVFLPGNNKDEALRILSLDTEESRPSGSKPVTKWGKEAKKKAEDFFSKGSDKVTLEFPGKEELKICLKKYRGNYGRLLVHVFKDGTDFQEEMIKEGYSPYFSKYGYASFLKFHEKYVAAERKAQQEHIGVWDQMTVNNAIMRNYPALTVWWNLRATIINEYRLIKNNHENLLNSRLDYEEIEQKAKNGDSVTIFTELNSVKRISEKSALVLINSQYQPFSLFLPNAFSDEDGQRILNLLNNRYISHGEEKPGRSYAYVTGELSLFKDKPQIVVTKPEQITDSMAIN